MCIRDRSGESVPMGPLAPHFLQSECQRAAVSNAPFRAGAGQMVTVMFKPNPDEAAWKAFWEVSPDPRDGPAPPACPVPRAPKHSGDLIHGLVGRGEALFLRWFRLAPKTWPKYFLPGCFSLPPGCIRPKLQKNSGQPEGFG